MWDSTQPASNPASSTLSPTPRSPPTWRTILMTSTSCTGGTWQAASAPSSVAGTRSPRAGPEADPASRGASSRVLPSRAAPGSLAPDAAAADGHESAHAPRTRLPRWRTLRLMVMGQLFAWGTLTGRPEGPSG